MSDASSIRIILADDQALVRGGLAALLALEPDIEVVAEVGRGDELQSAVAEHRPDVCVVDIEMPGGDGISVTRWIRESYPRVRVLIVTTFGRPGSVSLALDPIGRGVVASVQP